MTYTTAALIEAELQSSSFTSGTTPSKYQVGVWIEESEAIIEVIAGEVFSSTVETSEYLDYDGRETFRPQHTPIITVDEIKYNRSTITSATEDWITLEEGRGKNYVYYADEGEIIFINGSGATNLITPRSGSKRLCLSYTYGHLTVPKEIQRLATLMVAKRVISSLINSQANTEGGEVTVGPITVKDPSNFSVSYISSLNQDIKDLTDSIGQGFKTFRSGRVY